MWVYPSVYAEYLALLWIRGSACVVGTIARSRIRHFRMRLGKATGCLIELCPEGDFGEQSEYVLKPESHFLEPDRNGAIAGTF